MPFRDWPGFRQPPPGPALKEQLRDWLAAKQVELEDRAPLSETDQRLLEAIKWILYHFDEIFFVGDPLAPPDSIASDVRDVEGMLAQAFDLPEGEGESGTENEPDDGAGDPNKLAGSSGESSDDSNAGGGDSGGGDTGGGEAGGGDTGTGDTGGGAESGGGDTGGGEAGGGDAGGGDPAGGGGDHGGDTDGGDADGGDSGGGEGGGEGGGGDTGGGGEIPALPSGEETGVHGAGPTNAGPTAPGGVQKRPGQR